MITIPIKPSRVRKPTAPRTCCQTHRDTCNFGREHVWGIGFYADGVWVGDGSARCETCGGVCTGDVEGSV